MRSRSSLVLLGVMLFQLSANAAEPSFQLALDTDHDSSTGCATDLGDLQSPNIQPGFEVRVEVRVDASFSPPRTGAIELVRCLSGAWAEGAAEPISEGGWEAAIDTGQLGGDSIEAFVPLTELGLPTQVRLALRATSLSGEVDVIDSQASTPIVLALGSAVPTLRPIAMLILAAALLLLSFRFRQRRTSQLVVILLATSVAAHAVHAAVLMWDGDISDWGTIPALATDPANDVDDPDGDLIAIYVQDSEGMLIFRTDLQNLEVPGCSFDAGSSPNPLACSCGSTACAAGSICDASTSTCEGICSGNDCLSNFPSGDPISSGHPCSEAGCEGCPDSCADQTACDLAVLNHCATNGSDPGCSGPGGTSGATGGSECYDGCGGNLCATSAFPSGDPGSSGHPCNEVGCHGCPYSCANEVACSTVIAAHCATYPSDPSCLSGGSLCVATLPE